MAGSLVVLAVFVVYERHRIKTVGSPLVVLGLFRARTFTAGMMVWLLFWIALGGFFLVWTLYMQVGLGWTPLRAGLTGATFAIGAAAGAGTSVQVLTPRFGRKVLTTGALLNALAFVWYGWVAYHYGPSVTTWEMLAPLVLAGIGFGLVVAPIIDLILTGVPTRDAGSASGLLNTTQQVGMALGVALVGVLFFAQLDHDSGRGVDKVTPAVQQELTAAGIPAAQQNQIITGFRACVRDRSAATDPTAVPASCRTGATGPQAERLQALLTSSGAQANSHNFARTFALTLQYAVGLLVLVFLGMFFLPRRAEVSALEAEMSALDETDRQPVT
jgi:hypothetical protein